MGKRPAMQCTAITRKGCQCRYKAREGETMCGIHLPKPTFECPICYDSFPDTGHKRMLLSCGHKICWTCIKEWNKHNSTCPMCRAEVLPKAWVQPDSPRTIIRNLLGEFDQVEVEGMMDFQDEEERQHFLGFMNWVAYPETQPMPSLEI